METLFKGKPRLERAEARRLNVLNLLRLNTIQSVAYEWALIVMLVQDP